MDTSAADKYRALAGLADKVNEISFNVGKKIRTEQGQKAGLEAGITAAKEGTPIESKGGLLSQFSIFDQSYNESMKTAYVSQLSTDTATELDRLQTEYADDINGFNAVAPAYIQQTLAGVSPEFEPIVRSDLVTRLNRVQTKIYEATKKKNTAAAYDKTVAAVNLHADEAAQLSRDGDLAAVGEETLNYLGLMKRMVDAGQVSQTDAEIAVNKFKTRNRQQQILGDIDRTIFNEGLTLQDRYVAGQALVNQVREQEFTDLSPEDKDALINLIQAKVSDVKTAYQQEKSQVSLEDARRVSNLQIAAQNNLRPAEEIATETEQMFDDGLLTGPQRTSIYNDIHKKDEAADRKAASIERVSQHIDGVSASQPMTQNDVDTFYDAAASDLPTGEARTLQQVNFVESVRLIPKALKEEVSNSLISGDPDRIKMAAELVDRVNQMPGMAGQLLNANQAAFAQTVTTLMAMMSPEEAVSKAMELTIPNNKDRVNAVEALIIDEKYADKYAGWTEDALGDMSVMNADKAIKEYQTLFETNLKAGFTKEAAREATDKVMAANWKEDPDFGFMKYPPSSYYAVGGDTSYMRDQLYADVIRDVFIPAGFDKEKDMHIFSDSHTARTAAKGAPEYKVAIVDNNGEIQFLDGYWSPDVNKEAETQKQENAGDIARRRNRATLSAKYSVGGISMSRQGQPMSSYIPPTEGAL